MKGTVTYSSAHTIVPTYECFNHCTYCNFRQDIGQNPWLTISDCREQLQQLKLRNVSEILVLSGEVHPLASNRKEWFARIEQICESALSMGFLPHTNAGILSWQEMKQLKEVNFSMGLMLEQLTPKLLTEVHKNAPSKQPQLRLEQLEWAGKLRIPFTTGLLLGIGETEADWWDTLKAIAFLQEKWGHIQEVILQPYSQGSNQSFTESSFNIAQLPKVVAKAREILSNNITIQIPPNLVSQPGLLLDCLEAGARDLGGISVIDEVNPDYPHPTDKSLAAILEPAGWQLVPRLPVYPQYYSWLSPSLRQIIEERENV
jgi:FO synthase subunit 1